MAVVLSSLACSAGWSETVTYIRLSYMMLIISQHLEALGIHGDK